MEERITQVEERADSTDFGLVMVNNKVAVLEKTKDSLQEEVTYLQSHSMGSNLVLSSIPEATRRRRNYCERLYTRIIEGRKGQCRHNKVRVSALNRT
ncbi:hypothetical protein DPMN_042889 [Dreissena polymorpha]|uniref:Uncharacterized protein n=1 Tax=Dreissena polymorpha TaxID=45954 RepID=A0A9D4D1R8_DREPO|nr:hypothetical protein DPMN_042889 [Dreissena polymorpha]